MNATTTATAPVSSCSPTATGLAAALPTALSANTTTARWTGDPAHYSLHKGQRFAA